MHSCDHAGFLSNEVEKAGIDVRSVGNIEAPDPQDMIDLEVITLEINKRSGVDSTSIILYLLTVAIARLEGNLNTGKPFGTSTLKNHYIALPWHCKKNLANLFKIIAANLI